MTHWIYTEVVRAILTYGWLVRWESLNKTTNLNLIHRFQLSACIIISGALRTTPTIALEMILYLLPLAERWRLGLVGIFGEIDIVRSSGYMTVRYDLPMNFKTSITKRENWRKCTAHLAGDSAQIYTNGFKLKGAVGIGIYSRSIGISKSIRLLDHCSCFQAEVSAIQAVVKIIMDKNVNKRKITILVLSDSQTSQISQWDGEPIWCLY